MQRWKATLAYDGTDYHGWQIQPDRPTVQGVLAQSLHHITGETVLPQGSGRTDTGVHALAQVAHFDLACPIPPENLHRALNRSLPPAIRITTLTHCLPDFHARHSALGKTYEYRILPRPQDHETICPPFLAPYIWPCPQPLSLHLLNQAATQILGTHDFTSFAAINPDQSTRQLCTAQEKPSSLANDLSPLTNLSSFRNAGGPAFSTCHKSLTQTTSPSSLSRNSYGLSFRSEAEESAFAYSKPSQIPNTRTIHSSNWTLDTTHNPPILRYRVTGSGFLHHMVRNLVGTFAECGASRLNPDKIPQILAARNRQAAGPTAPPQGLFLVEVAY